MQTGLEGVRFHDPTKWKFGNPRPQPLVESEVVDSESDDVDPDELDELDLEPAREADPAVAFGLALAFPRRFVAGLGLAFPFALAVAES